MKTISYKQSEFLMPWKWRKKDLLPDFILKIPYCIFMNFIPSKKALNEVLDSGSAGGGMGTGFYWEPFTLSEQEYQEVIKFWQSKKEQFILDHEIMEKEKHLDYLGLSSKKYNQKA